MDFVTSPQALPGTTFLSDLFTSLLIHLPFAPPPFAAADRAICAAVLPLNTNLKQNVLHLSAESTDDVNVGAVLSRSRRKASGAHDDDSDGSTETGRGGVHPVPEISGDSMLHVPNAPQPQPPLPPRPINQYSPYSSLAPMVSSTSPRLNSADKPPPMEDVWVVLRDYLTNVTLGAQGRARALQSIAEAVVAACAQDNNRIENNANQSGRGMLTEIVRRMRGAERSERDGSVFTLLVNVAAAHGGGVVVERVTHAVFSDVVEEMHGRQDDKVMWERALRCFHILLKTSNYHISEFHHEHYFTTHSNTNISTKCIMALALHVGDIAHADVDHVLVANGLCPRLRSGRSDLSTGIIDIDKAVLLEIGGVDGISSLLVNTASVTTRHLLFGIAFDVAILEAVDAISSDLNYKTGNDIGTMTGNINDNLVLKDQVTALRSFFHAYDMADLLVHTFRVGPWSTFVPDLMHMLLIQPLTHELLPSPSALSITSDGLEKREEPELPLSEHKQLPQQQTAQQQSTNQQSQQQQQQKGQQQANFQKQRGSGSVTNSHASDEDALPKMFQPMAEEYVSSVGKLVKHLDKRLCLKTLQSLQYMAQRQSMQLQRREIMHHPREWRLLKAVETQIQYFYTQNALERDPSTNITSVASNSNSNTGFQSLQQQQLHQQRLQRREANLDAVLEKMYESVEELTSQRASLRALVRMMELLIEFFTIRPPFGSTAKLYAGVHFQSTMHELHAEGGRDSFARLFLRGQVGAPRALLHRAKPNIFTLLLIASRQQASVKRVSENRQCLVEFLGASKDRASCLKEFTDDDDAALAYRAKEIVCKYSDSSIHARSRSLTTFDEDD